MVKFEQGRVAHWDKTFSDIGHGLSLLVDKFQLLSLLSVGAMNLEAYTP